MSQRRPAGSAIAAAAPLTDAASAVARGRVGVVVAGMESEDEHVCSLAGAARPSVASAMGPRKRPARGD